MIAGLQKMTLLDYPGKVACTVFLQGCNFRCPFCHNSGLLGAPEQPLIPEEALLSFLQKRQGLLDGVCITGGEPTLHKNLPEMLTKIKNLGFSVKLDTNGYRPEVLKSLVREGLVDYAAMDIKNCPERYAETAGIPNLEISKIEESMVFLLNGTLDYEFRTTVVRQFHTEKEIQAIGQWFQHLSPNQKVKKYFLQPYTDRDSVLLGGLSAPNKADLRTFQKIAATYVHNAEIRGDEL